MEARGNNMNNKSPIAILFALLMTLAGASFAPAAAAQCVNDNFGNAFCPPPGGGCVKEIFDKVKCSAADGGILLNRFQQAECGPGQCITNRLGEIFCSKEAKGYATVNGNGDAACTGGCIRGSVSACVTPTK
jgi:hypothetical protein